MTINLTDPANHPANGPLTAERIERVIEALQRSIQYQNGGDMAYVIADAIKGLEELLVSKEAASKPVPDEELDQMIWKLERDGMTPKMLSLMRELREVRKAKGEPYGYVHKDIYENNGSSGLSNDHEAYRDSATHIPLYTAPPSPVTPDGWIPVTERMPDGSEEVLCAKEFDGPGDCRQKVGYRLAGKWTVYGASWTPTHWQKLPAAPQEVK